LKKKGRSRIPEKERKKKKTTKKENLDLKTSKILYKKKNRPKGTGKKRSRNLWQTPQVRKSPISVSGP